MLSIIALVALVAARSSDSLVPGNLDITDRELLYASEQAHQSPEPMSVVPLHVERWRMRFLLRSIDYAIETKPLNESTRALVAKSMALIGHELARVYEAISDYQ